MKTLQVKDLATLTLQAGEETPTAPAQQVTVSHTSQLNRKWARGVQLSSQFIFIKRHGCPTVGMHVDDLMALAVQIEPKLSWTPLFTKHPESVLVKPDGSAFFEVEVSSELTDLAFRWQVETEAGTWVDIPSETARRLCSKSEGVYRCAAVNEAGESFSKPAALRINEPEAVSSPS